MPAAKPHKPKFIWQAVSILLPVLVLAGVGFVSLRQDKRIAQSEAAERAQSIADDLVTRIWLNLTQSATNRPEGDFAFQVDTAGELLSPPPITPGPIPEALQISELQPAQAIA